MNKYNSCSKRFCYQTGYIKKYPTIVLFLSLYGFNTYFLSQGEHKTIFKDKIKVF